jgi:uncharacterized protein YqhQ
VSEPCCHPKPAIKIGGQAVIEGVMMRSPKAVVVAVRRPDGSIVTREERSISWTKRHRLLGWPVIRGGVVLIQTLIEGMRALSYSANQALEEGDEEISPAAMAGTLVFAFALAIAFFVVLPHLATLWIGKLLGTALTVDQIAFHAIDGVIKLAFFLGYIVAISQWKDIRRVFEYHGAEHKSIFAYEAGKPLTVESAAPESTLHPRCGTAFILAVLVISIVAFAVLVPLLLPAGLAPIQRNALAVLLKVVLMFPIAGLGYEVVRLAGKYPGNLVLRAVSAPGLLLQKLTTKPPDERQVEVALTALRRALEMEESEGA